MAVPAAPLPPVIPIPLAGSLAWEGVVEEELQVGMGVGLDEACVQLPPPSTRQPKHFQGFPPIFQILAQLCADPSRHHALKSRCKGVESGVRKA